MLKKHLSFKKFFFAPNSEIINVFIKNLHFRDEFEQYLISDSLHNKKLKFIKKTPYFPKLDQKKRYVIFLDQTSNKNLYLLQKHSFNGIIYLHNEKDKNIYLFEII
jgi:hypothetical protein